MARVKDDDPTPRRTERIFVRVTPEEKADILARAEQALGPDPNLSDFARTLMLDEGKTAPAIRNAHAIRGLEAAITHVGTEVTRVGTNINQLAHVANATRAMPSERALMDALSELDVVKKRMFAVWDKVFEL